MLSKKDLQKIGTLVDERLEFAETRLSSKFDEKFEVVKRDLRNEVVDAIQKDAAKVRSDIAKFKDEILSEIVDLRSDMAVTEGYGDRLEDHGERIEKLEQKVFHATA